MSFLGGAECSTAGNPLSQFTKHVQDDKSLQRDRLVDHGSGGLQESFRSRANGSSQDEVSVMVLPDLFVAFSTFPGAGSCLTRSYR